MRLRRLILSLLGVALCTASSESAAQARVRPSIDESATADPVANDERPLALADLVHHAGTIFAGTVTRIEAEQHDGAATPGVVWITFRVTRWVRGEQPSSIFTLREWAGLWNGTPRYRVGQLLVLFLYPESTLGFSSPVGGSAGIIPIAEDQTANLAPAIAEPIRAKRLKGSTSASSQINLMEFLRSIREQVESDSR